MDIFSRLRVLAVALSLLITSLINPVSSSASSINFVKDSQNPLNTNFFALQSTVAKENGEYKMWFTGSNGGLKLGYATSTDGVNWPSHTFVSVNDTGDNHDPSLFVHEGVNYLYYISEPTEGSGIDIKIKRAITNGSQLSEPEIINLPRQSWNSQKLSCPFVYFEGGTYFLFYCGTNGSGWNMGLALSTDGINYSPCSNNPIATGGNVGNSQIYLDGSGLIHLIYHTDSGITEAQTASPLSCNSVWSNHHTLIAKDKAYDQTQIIAPSLVSGSLRRELYYTARGSSTSGAWMLNRAIELTSSKPKIVIVPGFFASWNQDAILHNQTVNQADWKIPSYIHEYEGLTKTLENLGLTANDEFYVFPYDWRKSLNDSAEDLRQFLQANIWNFDESANVSLVGHSMGGLLSRIYGQKYPEERLKTLITAGAPHRGVIQTYQPLEAGETRKDDTALWLGTKLLINLNRKNFNNDRVTVQTIIPSLYDLIPTFDFLKNPKGDLRPITSLSIQNSTLMAYADIGNIADKMTVIYGNKSSNSSPLAYSLTNRALIDRINGDYVDGRPFRTISGPGDYLVPTVSSIIGDRTEELPLDHAEIIFSKSAISKILDLLGLDHEDGDVVEGSATKITPSLIITIQSPVEAWVQVGPHTYYAENGIIFIPNATTDSYSLSVKKLQPGDYTITVAQVAQQNDVWEQFTGTIEEKNVNEEDRYLIKFDSNKVKPQISKNNCVKYKRGMFNFWRKLTCKLKNLRRH